MRPRTDTQTDRHTDARDQNTFLVVYETTTHAKCNNNDDVTEGPQSR